MLDQPIARRLRTIGSRFKKIRARKGIPLADLACQLRITLEIAERIERDEIEPTQLNISLLAEWAKALGYRIGMFVDQEPTDAERYSLFLSKLWEAQSFALAELSRPDMSSPVTPVECGRVLKMIRGKYDLYVEEQAKPVLFNREGAEFKIDEFDVVAMLEQARRER